MRAFKALVLLFSIAISLATAAGEADTPLGTLKKARVAFESCDVRAMLELTAAHQRENLSDQAIAQAENRCKGDKRRAGMAQALKVAEGLKPIYEKDGAVAVFDLSGMGFSKADEKIRMMRIEGKWYLFEK